MTTIVAVRDGERTWIGSDTIAVRDGLKVGCGPKWVRFGGYAVGISGDHRVISICAKYSKRLMDDLEGAFDFTERMEALLRDYNVDLSPAPDHAMPNSGQDMILACPSTVWSVGPCFSVIECKDFWAEGSGGRFALGALTALQRFNRMKSEDMARVAVEIGMQHDTATGGEIFLECLE